jgi:hypothetical protein
MAAAPQCIMLAPGRAAAANTLLAIACSSGPAATTAAPRGDAIARPTAEIVSCVDLPRGDARSHNLSGLAWDPAERRLFAISDREKLITVLEPRPGFLGFDLRPSITLDIDVDVERWDGEALAIVDDRFLVVANETEGTVFSVDRTGRDATRLELPPFRGARDNLGLEGIGYAASAEGRYVFVVNEEALEGDGPVSTAAHGTVVRILRHPLDGGADLEVAYLTDPIFADGEPSDNGVSDLAPLSPERLLLIERAYVTGKGNAVRVYEVDLRAASNIAALPDARAAVPVSKRLVVDLAVVSDERCSTPPGPQRRKTLDNYEGLALGPTLEDGRRVVFLVSDDNMRASQAPRVLTLAVAPGAL